MTQQTDILAHLAKGADVPRRIAQDLGIGYDTVNAHLAVLKRKGLARRIDAGGRCQAVWGLTLAPRDDPTMIPGGPPPTCEVEAAEAEARYFPPDPPSPADELPSADAVAVAVIAAAQVMDEDPLAIAEDGWLRCRFPAVKALRVFYPDCDTVRLGRYVGLRKFTEGTLRNFESAKWWPDLGEAAFAAAVEALEQI